MKTLQNYLISPKIHFPQNEDLSELFNFFKIRFPKNKKTRQKPMQKMFFSIKCCFIRSYPHFAIDFDSVSCRFQANAPNIIRKLVNYAW